VILLITEIKGKISTTGSNLNDRLEDELTGDLFGSLRYISFNKVMKNILLKTKVLREGFSNVLDDINRLDIDYWNRNIQFWPYDSLGELDVLLEFENIVIGIEVKLYSRLSSDDDVDNSNHKYIEESNNQLSRESRILKKKIFGTNKSALLIFIAPEYICFPICKEASKRNIIEDGVILGYLPWEEILITLERMFNTEVLNKYEELIIKDLITLLKRKGLERFKSFDFECPIIDSNSWLEFNIKKDIEIDFTFNQVDVMEEYYEFK
jgi:hypothetical protein